MVRFLICEIKHLEMQHALYMHMPIRGAHLFQLDVPLLRRLLRACARTDRIAKGVLDGDDWLSLEAVVLGLAGVAPLALAAGLEAEAGS